MFQLEKTGVLNRPTNLFREALSDFQNKKILQKITDSLRPTERRGLLGHMSLRPLDKRTFLLPILVFLNQRAVEFF
jgi:hypothetical protein